MTYEGLFYEIRDMLFDDTRPNMFDDCNHIGPGGVPTQMRVNGRHGYEVAPRNEKNVGKPIKEEKQKTKKQSSSLKRMLRK